MVIALLVPFLAVIIGVAKIDDCPVNSMIPVYLVSAVSGHFNEDKAKWSYMTYLILYCFTYPFCYINLYCY